MDIIKEIEERVAELYAEKNGESKCGKYVLSLEISQLEWVLDMLKQQQASIDEVVEQIYDYGFRRSHEKKYKDGAISLIAFDKGRIKRILTEYFINK